MGPVKLMTAHYPAALIESKGYTGFSALYGDTITATRAGMHWDRVLMDYCSGRRAEPVWGIAGSDFHGEKDGVGLDSYQTVFLVENRGHKDVLQALERGRIYAVRKAAGFRLSLDQFQIKDDETGKRAILGEELRLEHTPVVEGRLSATDGGHYSVAVSIIRGGKPIWSFDGQTQCARGLSASGGCTSRLRRTSQTTIQIKRFLIKFGITDRKIQTIGTAVV